MKDNKHTIPINSTNSINFFKYLDNKFLIKM